MDPHPVLQVGQVRPGRFALHHGGAQGVQKCALQNWIVIGVLGQQPGRPGTVLAGHCAAWASARGQQLTQPPGVGLVDSPQPGGDVVRQHRYRPAFELDQMPDPLILIAPGQQLAPEFFVHAAIPPRRALSE